MASTRHQAREQALSLLYEAHSKHLCASEVLAQRVIPPDPYVVSLLEGLDNRLEEVDALVSSNAIGWDLERMAVVDRITLRMATLELMRAAEQDREAVPLAVSITEAIELVRKYSTDDSPRFVNGVLSAVAASLGMETSPPAELSLPGGGSPVQDG